ncbi:hypothetical protein PSHT_12997 [Puccinia striiformis]|uniref:Uncharacterized protein n=1 Tax=Puccinia striiformis TaxID=27350 RepID=A0A2S4UT63_9BASI|nr:hypothetical protein PSHT_12997 [Puccinia striiformis]
MRRVTHCLLAFPLVEDLIRTASARPGLWTPHNTIHESTLLSSAYAQSDHARPVLEAEDERFSKQPRLNRVANGEAYYLPANDHGATYQAHDFPGTGTGRHAPYNPEPLENHLHFHPEIAEGLDLQQLQRLIRVRAVSDTPYHPAPSQEHSQSYPGIWEGLDLQQLQSLLSDPELFSGHANVNQAGSGSHAEQQLYGSGHSPFDQQIHASGDPNFQQQLHHVGVPGIDSHFQQQLHGSGPSSLDQQLHGPGDSHFQQQLHHVGMHPHFEQQLHGSGQSHFDQQQLDGFGDPHFQEQLHHGATHFQQQHPSFGQGKFDSCFEPGHLGSAHMGGAGEYDHHWIPQENFNQPAMMHSSDAPPNNIHFDNSNYLLPDGHQQLVDHEQLQTHGSSAPLSSADVSMFHGQAGASGHVVDNQGHPMEPLQHHINWQSLEQHYPFHAEAHSMHSDIYQNPDNLEQRPNHLFNQFGHPISSGEEQSIPSEIEQHFQSQGGHHLPSDAGHYPPSDAGHFISSEHGHPDLVEHDLNPLNYGHPSPYLSQYGHINPSESNHPIIPGVGPSVSLEMSAIIGELNARGFPQHVADVVDPHAAKDHLSPQFPSDMPNPYTHNEEFLAHHVNGASPHGSNHNSMGNHFDNPAPVESEHSGDFNGHANEPNSDSQGQSELIDASGFRQSQPFSHDSTLMVYLLNCLFDGHKAHRRPQSEDTSHSGSKISDEEANYPTPSFHTVQSPEPNNQLVNYEPHQLVNYEPHQLVNYEPHQIVNYDSRRFVDQNPYHRLVYNSQHEDEMIARKMGMIMDFKADVLSRAINLLSLRLDRLPKQDKSPRILLQPTDVVMIDLGSNMQPTHLNWLLARNSKLSRPEMVYADIWRLIGSLCQANAYVSKIAKRKEHYILNDANDLMDFVLKEIFLPKNYYPILGQASLLAKHDYLPWFSESQEFILKMFKSMSRHPEPDKCTVHTDPMECFEPPDPQLLKNFLYHWHSSRSPDPED